MGEAQRGLQHPRQRAARRARLCGIATPGQLLISEATLAKLKGKVEVEELPPAALKGKEKPFRIFDVKRLAPAVQVPASISGE